MPPPRRTAPSPGESPFDRLRYAAGFVLAPLAFVIVLNWPGSTLSPEAQRLAAIMSAVVILWVTESLPMPVTALLGGSAAVVCQVAPDKTVFPLFADPLLFLFIGSFILARALFLHGLDRRLAYTVLSLGWVGSHPSRILFAFGAVSAFMSMWISNTATTAMMFAIGLSILRFLDAPDGSAEGPSAVRPEYATGLLLMTSFAASIGGLATPIGTPPNIIGLSHINSAAGVEISFLRWMAVGLPVVAATYALLFVYMNWRCSRGTAPIEGARELLRQRSRELGPWSVGEKSTLAACLATVVMWVGPGLAELFLGREHPAARLLKTSLPESTAALLGAALLFVLPGGNGARALTWKEAVQIDWGVVLLYGGGMALGNLAQQTGLTEAIGRQTTSWLAIQSPFTLLVAASALAVLVSEATSNTASATIVVPFVISYAKELHLDPVEPALAATMACSLGFMLPVSTPCNAIVYGSGRIPLARMIRYGMFLDMMGIVVIVALTRVLRPLVA